MWIVRLALDRPYTFVVAALLIVITGTLTIFRMPTDIFPSIDVPVLSVIFNYTGMSPDDMERRIVTPYERILTTTVNDIEHIESQSLTGVGIIKVYFQETARIEAATSQVTAVSQTAIRQMPAGTQPPLVIRYSASTVPILQVSIGSKTLPEQQLFDLAINTLRPQIVVIPGVQLPWPYGGKQRQVMVDLDPERLYARGTSPSEVSTAINDQNLILPAGTAKIGAREYQVRLNSSPPTAAGIADLPVRATGGVPVYVSDVASVRDGFSVQTNIVRSDGVRGALLSAYKAGNASTLSVADAVKEVLPKAAESLPKELEMKPLFDQSVFVRASIEGVVKEGVIAAVLTGLMILLFLGSWRSTVVVIVSIPLSVLVAILVLNAAGETLNVMTLGGLALAVGILVDDATVEIENIHRNLAEGKPLVRAILDGAQQIAVPAFVATLCICTVFIPVAFVSGAAKYLFTPLALAVVSAMMTSYLLSRTLVPTMVSYLLRAEAGRHAPGSGGAADAGGRVPWYERLHRRFEEGFSRLRNWYGGLLAAALARPKASVGLFLGAALGSLLLLPAVGTDFFPTIDAGQMRLHVRAPAGTRIEETERYFGRVESLVREVVPPEELVTMISNIGIPNSGINLSLTDGTLIGPADGELMVALAHGHGPVRDYVRRIRAEIRARMPELVTWFAPADIASQVLNFGLAAPVNVRFAGQQKDAPANLRLAERFAAVAHGVPGVVDVRMRQVTRAPDLRVEVDRTLARLAGTTQRQVASDLLISLSSSNQTAPNFWLDPRSGVNYSIYVQTPQRRIDSVESLGNTPLRSDGGSEILLRDVAYQGRGASATNITHYNITPTYDVEMGVEGTDLGSVAKGLDGLLDPFRKELPRGSTVTVSGQTELMRGAIRDLSYGILFAVLLVYLLMVVNFQSWLDPFVILTALPGAAAGIVWMLFVTGTTVNVPSLMGSMMCIGVATANSILLVTFANEERERGLDGRAAAGSAGMVRLRPVLMTALAMIIGMLPMSLGIGEGGEQNAPLGRAVIGGLLVATVATLLFVPVIYSLLRPGPGTPRPAGARDANA